MAKDAKGQVVQVIGTVVDVEFPREEMPEVLNAIEVPMEGQTLVLEVQQHTGNNWVRCLALGPTEGLARGSTVVDTGSPILVPVGTRLPGTALQRAGAAPGRPRGGGGPGVVAHPPSASIHGGADDDDGDPGDGPQGG